MKENEQKIYDLLDLVGAQYSVLEHEPVFTAAELDSIKSRTEGIHCKNLFLRNAKGNKYYLISLQSDKDVDLKKVKDIIGSTRLSFASPERLLKVLNLVPGSVNPFSLVEDSECVVEFFLDKEVATDEKLNFHPGVNYKMVTIGLADLTKYLEKTNHDVNIVSL